MGLELLGVILGENERLRERVEGGRNGCGFWLGEEKGNGKNDSLPHTPTYIYTSNCPCLKA